MTKLQSKADLSDDEKITLIWKIQGEKAIVFETGMSFEMFFLCNWQIFKSITSQFY